LETQFNSQWDAFSTPARAALHRDIRPSPPLVLGFEAGSGAADGLSAVPSLTGAGSGQLNLASPGPPSRPSLCSTPGSSRPTGQWAQNHGWVCCAATTGSSRLVAASLRICITIHISPLQCCWRTAAVTDFDQWRCVTVRKWLSGLVFAGCPAGDHPWSTAHTPHSGTMSHAGGGHANLAAMSSPSMSGARQSLMGGPSSMSGLGPGSMLSRRPSCQIGHGDLTSPSRQSSMMSMVSEGVIEW